MRYGFPTEGSFERGQLSLGGVVSLIVARTEGLELSLSGATFGIHPFRLAITLPGLGRLSLLGDRV